MQALRRVLLEDQEPWGELGFPLGKVTNWLREMTGRGAMVITSDTAITVWRACQVPGIRAASAAEPVEVHRACQGLGLNLLVLEPSGKSISWMKQLGAAFRLGGAPRVPDDLCVEDRP